MTSVFISSTQKDLEEYRAAAIEICKQHGFTVIAMEEFAATDMRATAGSLKKVDEADLFILILAHRYGYIESGYKRSVTECEFDHATERGIDRLCFLVDPEHPWNIQHVDRVPELVELLAMFKEKVEKDVIRGSFTTVEDFSKKLEKSLDEWQPVIDDFTDTLSALLITDANSTPELPPEFVGREDLIAQIDQLLDNQKSPERKGRVFLHGIGGMGKTALAARIVHQHKPTKEKPALWLRVGDNDSNDLFQALAKPFNRQAEIARQSNTDERQHKIKGMLNEKNVQLIVLDNVSPERDSELQIVLEAVPPNIPVIITSLSAKPVSNEKPVAIEELNQSDSIALLSLYADQDLSGDAGAQQLCKQLDGHPLALRLAGITIKRENLTSSEYLVQILDRRIADYPTIRQVISASLRSLDDTTQEIFSHFGAFFAPGATQEMLVRYMKRIKEGETSEYLKEIRKALTALQQRDLVQQHRVEGIVDDKSQYYGNLQYYSMHNLVHNYVLELNQGHLEERRKMALDACLTYTRRFNTDNPNNRIALRLELDNLLGAANWAMNIGRYTDIEEFVRNLYYGSQLLQKEGFFEQTTELLSLASEAARRNRGVYLSNLGRMYRDLGKYDEALRALEVALTTYQEINATPDEKPIQDMVSSANEGMILGYLGLTYSDQGNSQKAIWYCDQALEIARKIAKTSDGSQERILDIYRVGYLGLSHANRNSGDYLKAEEMLIEAIKIVKTLGDKGRISRYQSYLGLIYAYLGQYADAIEHCQEGLEISRRMLDEESGKRRSECANLGYLGIFYLDLGQVEEALAHSDESLKIAREIAYKRGEGNRLGDLGQVYLLKGDYAKARQFHKDGLSIVDQIGAKRSMGYRLSGLIEAHLGLGEFNSTFDKYLVDLRAILDEQVPYPRDQHYWGTIIAQALIHRAEMTSSRRQADKILGEIQEFLEKILKVGDKTREHFTNVLYGIVLAKQNKKKDAQAAFNQAVTQSNDLLDLAPEFFSAKYTKVLAYSGLAIVGDDQEQQKNLARAEDAYINAKENCVEKGVIESTARLLKSLPDNDSKLTEIHDLLVAT